MPHPTTVAAVRHPITGVYEALNPAIDYASDDLMVKTYPWAFEPLPTASAGQVVESVVIEKATAEPGEKRSRRK